MVVKLVVLSNAVSFFGKDLAKNESFMESALAYIEETLICAEIVRLVPRLLAPIIGGIISSRLKSHEIIFNTLLPIAEQRCLERDLKFSGQKVPDHHDCIQWIMETSPKRDPWSAKRVVHELMAIWFGSVHALSTTITFAIHDICIHPEYVLPLRQELQNHYTEFERTGRGLPLLDSFIKESARLTPVESSKPLNIYL
ncbi:Ent-kaurene oxidase [Daldinia childiae]|uniref:Ent-kaurene oxidase n=1 Tax=Daldinia childiae TaxID=326645 RepID=UPI001447143C|nr:Ent-kaurene oxidase [Daldinia childiae]XP_033439921.1 Ent-kaurene oxidase [Daldinia childiae]KAF3060320.1 Ent-kaurene oxidase [Daldinia childiae]KAF3066381.1 Ent-kaurene oxidase [Daldinia childiae]